MRILISNDDGFDAQGIKILVQNLSKEHEVVVVAPNENKSASSSSLTLDRPLQPVEIKKNFYSVDATPSDCVHLALSGLLDEAFDLVVTGINFGPNLGDDVVYSGTVAGAIEGRFLGLPSLAISLASWQGKHFETAGIIAKKLLTQITHAQLSHDTILNVNVPDVPLADIQGFQTTRLGKRHQSEKSVPDKDDASKFWIGENGAQADNGVGTDFHAIANNYVSVTPLQIDLTKYNEIDTVSTWLETIK
ncbi:5'-nucleotidase SurE (EC 3.1.3.5) [uncultured Gammaproteobacteria bacterium]|uniref:5'-nucleotidase SurE n=3 Tax=sulfur-oxidizing symbionts TaxID=32036 RepID=A0A1H6MC79_9GAMM|nr:MULTISPECIES: 5'/3'-nucleotidase SurE [sulfur-oxidizing symbionts]CAC9431780.1 5'-nucleotidase SurE (EC 3.1.3.5) [uncultured Gammaproteobacteria bacterium]CAB5498128.1 5'-nucleotidase SurE (EC [Bathymodiolus azoricus thioautotrophic gill symbiont]CAB5508170.1 5'-nucleotidase SurE (EC [Bathymodiolus thermophilus thioautotrophic gill symbiont]CAC9495295.1 5'-nucleotidase SurE (EC 3.1.3.5) [uncultured Gammaproteobacteria bacterium]CAC9503347.1 5'-nucleotidase SurE (EC 3.1.3.5) [uncultured Gamm